MNSGIPIFPTMIPNIVNPLWFSVDEPKNEDTELIRIESIHQNWVQDEDDEEDEEEEVNASDDSETHDEEDDDVEMDVTNTYDRDSPISVSTR
ncbi:anaphase-promoting complex subunit 15 isoform X2 [Metopolophium dirhodum]|uniref:anaphase-promoting complex subunit 15 isoform X2 n=1 Tax=Metopolophium dirhodum TaxID=44670 RepID=UPI002990446A|nr:anaphase-promoting complex subunit 15 isoform X2 [Metopolophium dirhodum]